MFGLKCGGLLLDRHKPPLTRRFVVYYCSAVYTEIGFQHGLGREAIEKLEQALLRAGLLGPLDASRPRLLRNAPRRKSAHVAMSVDS
jgi:hypothetical protein